MTGRSRAIVLAVMVSCLVSACALALPGTTAAPSLAAPSAAPSATASPGPTDRPSAIRVELANATGNRVAIEITDESRTLLIAESGLPGDGASVAPGDLAIINDDASTLRLTWVGGPCDIADSLAIDALRRRFHLVQPRCPGDSIVTDRILVLRFSQPIRAADVQGFVQEADIPE